MIDKNDVETNVVPDDTVNVDKSDNVSENEDSNWIVWVIIGAVILVCGGVTAVILIKKKR